MMIMYSITLRMTTISSNHGNAVIGTTQTGMLAVSIVTVLFVWFDNSTGTKFSTLRTVMLLLELHVLLTSEENKLTTRW